MIGAVWRFLSRRAAFGAVASAMLLAWSASAAERAAGEPSGFAPGCVAAVGGGDHDAGSWAREVFAWMMEKAGPGAAVVIIGSSPPPDPNEAGAAPEPDSRIEMFRALGAARVESLDIHDDNADLQSTYDVIASCRIVYIRGGAQSRYVQYWKGKKTEAAIRKVFESGGVVGGTSAGCAILGSVSYDALKGSLSTAEALVDARHEELTLTKNFLGCTPGVLYDTHFTERGRIGRLAVMLGTLRVDAPDEPTPLGVGVDERTALCVDRGGMGLVIGEGCVNLVRLSDVSAVRVDAGRPPLITELVVSRAPAGCRIDVAAGKVLWAWPTEIACGGAPKGATLEFRGGQGEATAGAVALRGGVWKGERCGKTLSAAFGELAACGRRVSVLAEAGAMVRVTEDSLAFEAGGDKASSTIVFRCDGRVLSGVPAKVAEQGPLDGVAMRVAPPGTVWTFGR